MLKAQEGPTPHHELGHQLQQSVQRNRGTQLEAFISNSSLFSCLISLLETRLPIPQRIISSYYPRGPYDLLQSLGSPWSSAHNRASPKMRNLPVVLLVAYSCKKLNPIRSLLEVDFRQAMPSAYPDNSKIL
jgi:hypothetical protein